MSERQLRVDPQVFQAILLSRIEKRLKGIGERLEAVEARGIPFSPYKIHQHKTIPAGGSGVVYEYDVKPYVAFIYYVGCKWFPNTYYIWEIDNVRREERIERTIGNASAPVSEPLRLEKPIVVREKIRWTAYNNDASDHVFEVLNDGVLYPQGIARHLGGAEFKR